MQAKLWVLTLLIMATGVMALGQTGGAGAAGNSCTELLINGNMETNIGWTFPTTAATGNYSTAQAFSPIRSARVGIVSGANVNSFSSARQQVTASPAAFVRLAWRSFPRSEPVDSQDQQSVSILKPGSTPTTLRTVWSGLRNDRAWLECSYNLSEFAGQEIIVNFTARNNGVNGKTAMFVDDVSLQACNAPQITLEGCSLITPTPTATATPTLTPTATTTSAPTPTSTFTSTPTETPTPSATSTPTASATFTSTPTPTATFTPTPTASSTFTPTPAATATATAIAPADCPQLIANPEFDQGNGYQGWAENLILTSSFTDLGGVTYRGAWFGGSTFSDGYLYQDVAIPAHAPVANLSFWWALNPPTPDSTLGAEEKLTITLRKPNDIVLKTLKTIGQGNAARRWRQATFDLSAYRGQTVRFHAASRTDDTTASWHLTKVYLFTCALDQSIYLPEMKR